MEQHEAKRHPAGAVLANSDSVTSAMQAGKLLWLFVMVWCSAFAWKRVFGFFIATQNGALLAKSSTLRSLHVTFSMHGVLYVQHLQDRPCCMHSGVPVIQLSCLPQAVSLTPVQGPDCCSSLLLAGLVCACALLCAFEC